MKRNLEINILGSQIINKDGIVIATNLASVCVSVSLCVYMVTQ